MARDKMCERNQNGKKKKKMEERKIRWIFVRAKFLRIHISFSLYVLWMDKLLQYPFIGLLLTASCMLSVSLTLCYRPPPLSLSPSCPYFMYANSMTHLLLHVACSLNTHGRRSPDINMANFVIIQMEMTDHIHWRSHNSTYTDKYCCHSK